MSSKWLKLRRKEINISQDELALRLQLAGQNISRGTVSHWEIDKTPIPLKEPEFANALANALELPVMDLLQRAGFIQSSELSLEASRAAAIVEALPPERRKAAIGILEELFNLKEG
jgi:transcriptional regulator with XRE-family HTH domain